MSSTALPDPSEPAPQIECEAEPCTEPSMQPATVPVKPMGLPTHLPLWQMVWALAWWPLLEQVLGTMVRFVDVALAGRLSPEATEAIGATGYVLWLMGLMQGAVGVGSTAIVARMIGAGDRKQAELAVGQSMLLALGWGACNGVLFWIAAPYIGGLVSLEGIANDYCTQYLRILALVAPCRAVLFIGGACLRGAGDMRTPFYVMLLVNIVNVIASIALVWEGSPIGGMEVRGVALGTMIAWIVGGGTMWAILLRGRGGVRLHTDLMRFERVMTGRLVRIGLPALAENGGHWLGNLAVVVMVGMLATLGMNEFPMGSNIVAIQLESFSFLPGFAFGMAAATITGQYLGVGDPVMARKAAWVAAGYGALIMGICGVMFMAIPEVLVRILTDEPVFLEDASKCLFHAGWAQLGFAGYLVFSGVLRGAGDTKFSMKITFFSTYVIRIPLAWLIGIHWGYGLEGIWVALAFELTLRGGFLLARFLHGGWAKIKV